MPVRSDLGAAQRQPDAEEERVGDEDQEQEQRREQQHVSQVGLPVQDARVRAGEPADPRARGDGLDAHAGSS